MENVRSIIERKKRNGKVSNKALIVQKLSERITLQKRYIHLKLTNAQAFFTPPNIPNFLSHSLSIEQNYHSDCIAVSNFPSASDLNSTFSYSLIQIVFHSMLTLAIALLCALSLVKLEFSPFSVKINSPHRYRRVPIASYFYCKKKMEEESQWINERREMRTNETVRMSE